MKPNVGRNLLIGIGTPSLNATRMKISTNGRHRRLRAYAAGRRTPRSPVKRRGGNAIYHGCASTRRLMYQRAATADRLSL